MNRLLRYHTTACNPSHYWENNEVAKQLKANTITTYEQYKMHVKVQVVYLIMNKYSMIGYNHNHNLKGFN